MQRRGPDSLEGWFIALICCLIGTLMYGLAGLSSMLFVASIERYSTDRNQAAFPYILCSVLQAATGPMAGFLAKRFDERAVVMAGGVLAFVGIGTCFFAETIIIVTVLWGIVFGAGFGLSSLLLPAIINYYFIKHRSKALGLSYLGSPIGFLIFPPIFEVLLNKYGLSGTFLFLSGIIVHCIPLSLLLRKPNFKNDLPNQPLCGREQVTYSSTNSGIASQKLKFVNGGKHLSDEIRTSIPCFKRYSLEFLWQPTSKEQNIYQYVFNLNKNCSCSNCIINRESRSYEKINGNFYKKLDKGSCTAFSSLPSRCSIRSENSNEIKLKINRNFDEMTNFPDRKCESLNELRIEHSIRPENHTKKFNKIKDVKEEQITKLSNLKHDHVYAQFSSIYFGTNEKTRNIEKCIVSTLCTSNSTNAKKTEEYTNICYSNSVTEIDCTKSTSSTTLTSLPSTIVSNIPDYRAVSRHNQNSETGKASQNFNKSLFSIYYNPLFILMSMSNAIFNLQFITMTTVIIDFARDHGIDEINDKFIMMCLALMGACGMMGFGWVTDGGYLRRNRFASLCLLIGSICTAILPLTVGFTALMIVLALWSVSQSSFVLLIPAILAEYFHEDVQTVAISACNVLCAPLYFIIPPLIGYFRDGRGSYDNIFYLLSFLSLLNSMAVFTVPWIAKLKNGTSNR